MEKDGQGQRKGEKKNKEQSKVELDWTGSNSGLISCGGSKVNDLVVLSIDSISNEMNY